MARGLKIAKEGIDVDNAKQRDLYVDTTTPLLKLYMSGDGKQTMKGNPGESYDIVITHNLGYIPFFLVYCDTIPGGARTLCSSHLDTDSQFSAGAGGMVAFVTKKIITLTLDGFGGTPTPGTYGYSYFIYYDRVI